MEFRSPSEADRLNAQTTEYLTENLTDPTVGKEVVQKLIEELGNAVDMFPDWHPILTMPQSPNNDYVSSMSELDAYRGIDHTKYFVSGFVTCPYSVDKAERLVKTISQIDGLDARRLNTPLYMDNAYPVVVHAYEVILEADGTIRSRDALAWFAQGMVRYARSAEVAETWWNIRTDILGSPHGARSSLFVNQHTGIHMRKILETLNESGVFGPIKESSLAMLSKKKRDQINDNIFRAAIDSWNGEDGEFEFELRGETCKARMRDTWDDGYEISIQVNIGNFDLYSNGFYYKSENHLTYTDPRGKRAIAEKFLG